MQVISRTLSVVINYKKQLRYIRSQMEWSSDLTERWNSFSQRWNDIRPIGTSTCLCVGIQSGILWSYGADTGKNNSGKRAKVTMPLGVWLSKRIWRRRSNPFMLKTFEGGSWKHTNWWGAEEIFPVTPWKHGMIPELINSLMSVLGVAHW